MINILIITFCILLLLAYVFDLTSAKTKIPTVILLLLLGWLLRQYDSPINNYISTLTKILPILGTIGLILIVLDGSLELQITSSNLKLLKLSLWGSIIPILLLSVLFVTVFYFNGFTNFNNNVINAIPLCIISSAIAIPTARNLAKYQKEYVTYESSLSDIFGVLLFNFFSVNYIININSLGIFIIDIIGVIIIAIVSNLFLIFLLNKIQYHVKFIPIILVVILVYGICKLLHLPGLIFILLFGLCIGNIEALKKLLPKKFAGNIPMNNELIKFKELTIEVSFIIRVMFFLLFGFLLDTKDIFNPNTAIWALVIVLLIIIVRYFHLKFSKLPTLPLLFIAPRGLITILLFLSIEMPQRISFVSKSLIIQIVLMTSIILIFSLFTSQKNINKV